MSKIVILLTTFLFAGVFCFQPFKETSKPFFPSSSSSSTVAPSSNYNGHGNGAVQFSSDDQQEAFHSNFQQTKPAIIHPEDQQQQQEEVKPSLTFSTDMPSQEQSKQHIDPRFCTKINDPVCGSNQRTYGNLCMLTQDQRSDPSLTVVKQGEC